MRARLANYLLSGALAAWLVALASAALALSDDEGFLAAREAFQKGNIEHLSRLASELRDYPLYPYVAYWQLRSHMPEANAAVVEAFMSDYRDTLLSERVRADWLRTLGRNQDWEAFEREYNKLAIDDLELACYALQARLALHKEQSALKEARPMWYQGSVQPDSCAPLFDAMLRQGLLEEDDVWSRIRLALESGNVSFVRQLVSYLPAGRRPDPRAFDSVARNPQRYLEHASGRTKTRAERELTIFAVVRLAQSLPAVAATRFEKIQASFTAEEQAYAWGQLALAGAMKHRPESLDWFARAGERLSDRQFNWKVRAALRRGEWDTALSAIEAMSATEQQIAAWRYWKARALQATGRAPEGNALLAALSFEHSFYGQLAMEELGTVVTTTSDSYHPSEDEVAGIEHLPGIQRALKFYQLGLRYEGALEWRWTTRTFRDKELLAAAEVARRNGWFERSIDTAERTQQMHDFSLRYPTPYRDVLGSYTRQFDLDEAWVYALVRQESRFSAEARSNAGALGLMQLMPTTARSVARRLGIPGVNRNSVHTVDTNISLGTYHLRQLMDGLDNHPVLVAAAYNAGLGRAREWRAERALEGAIYTETIPFSETRDYVRKVMSNTMYYARLLAQPFVPLKQRLGQVPAKPLSAD